MNSEILPLKKAGHPVAKMRPTRAIYNTGVPRVIQHPTKEEGVNSSKKSVTYCDEASPVPRECCKLPTGFLNIAVYFQ